MKFNTLVHYCGWLALAVGSVSLAHAAPFTLSAADRPLSVYRINAMPGGELCIMGAARDRDMGTAQARVLVYSPAQNKILWDRTVAPPENMANSRFVACRGDGQHVWLGANIDTSTSPPLNQGLVYLYKFDRQGKQLDFLPVETGSRSAYWYDLDVDHDSVQLIGIATDEDKQPQANAIFLGSANRRMTQASVSKLATGAYAPYSAARLSKGVALLGGTFLPAKLSHDAARMDYAVSKIVSGKYQFSVRPQRIAAPHVATAITSADEIVSLGVQGKQSQLTVVGSTGKVIEERTLNSAWCATESIGATASTVYAVRRDCAESGQVKLVAVDRSSGAETLPEGVSGTPTAVFVVGTTVYVVSEKQNGAVMLQTIPSHVQ